VSARLFLFVLLTTAVIASAVAVVYARHQHRLQFVELSRLERERDELNIDYGRLQLEQATWSEANRVEQIARTRLGMVPPEGKALVVVKP
jgi:cell division protein FtsL